MTVKLYEVGGSVRDHEMGFPCDDLDYVAVCPEGWNRLLQWTEEELDEVYVTKPEFFTIKGRKGKNVIDIVLARKDGAYSDGRRPDTVEPGTLEDDLGRRDFGVNAMARDPETKKLIDPHGGLKDIENNVIRFVGDPGDRVREDALRVVRAMRFSVTKGMRLHKSITRMLMWNQLPDNTTVSRLLANISVDRFYTEINKMFTFDTQKSARLLFDERAVHPEIRQAIFGGRIWLKPSMAKK